MKNFGKIAVGLTIGATSVGSTFAANPLVDVANDTGSGAINTVWDFMSGPVGYVVYFVVGLSLVGLVVSAIKKWM